MGEDESITLKPAKESKDITYLADLAKNIWVEHYQSIISIEQVNYMLDKFQSVDSIKSAINNDNYHYDFIVNSDNDSVGYIAYKLDNEKVFVSKFYILKEYRSKGYGKKAIAKIKEFAKCNGKKAIYVTVNKKNINSLKAYDKFGFKNINSVVSDIGGGYVMDDYVLELAV